MAMFGHSLASERPEREVEVRIGGGQCWPKGEWRDVMSAAGSGFGETLDVLLAVSVAPQVSAGDRARGGVRLGSGRDFGVLVVAGNEIAEERGPP